MIYLFVDYTNIDLKIQLEWHKRMGMYAKYTMSTGYTSSQ